MIILVAVVHFRTSVERDPWLWQTNSGRIASHPFLCLLYVLFM